MSLLKAALGFVATAYMNDAVVKPRSTGKLARGYCDRVGKPLLLIRGERLVDLLAGEVVKAEKVQRKAYPLPYADKQFGAVVAVNVLETLRRPDVALREWRRVADKVFVVVPSWWSPQAWLDPSHRWLVHPNLTRVAPLWTGHRSVYLLPVSDRRYGGATWSPNAKTTSPSSLYTGHTSHRSQASQPPSRQKSSPELTDPHQTPAPEPLPALPDSLPEQRAMQPESPLPLYEEEGPFLSPDLPDIDDLTSSDLLPSGLGTQPSSSSNSPRHLTVVSAPESDDV